MALQKRRNLVVVTGVIILIAVIVLSSFVYLDSQNHYAGKVETISIGQLPNETESLIYVANDQKYFANNGINITFKNFASGAAAAAGVLNGEVNIGVATEFIVAEEALNNASICTFGTESKFLSFYVIARTDEGIQSISDLKGKTIGVAFGTIGQFYLGNFFQQYGLNSNSVTLVNVPLAGAQNALVNNTVNAVITLQPYVSQIESSLGNKVIAWQAQSNQYAYGDLVCANSWAEQNPSLIVRFLKSLEQAESFVQNHQSQAIAIVTKTLNYSATYLPTVWSNYQFSVTLDQSQIVAMQAESQWLIQNNLTNSTAIPNFLNYVYINGLESVNPDSVNIIG